MAGKPLVTNEDIETAVAALGRFIMAAPRLLLWVVICMTLFLCFGVSVGVVSAGGVAAAWTLIYALSVRSPAARRVGQHVGPLADVLSRWVGWMPGSKPDRQARRKGAAMVRKLPAAARDAGQSITHMSPNGSLHYTDPRGLSLEMLPLGVRLIVSPTARHTAEGLAKMQDGYASRLGIKAPERLVGRVLDQKRVGFDWEYLDPYEGVRRGVAAPPGPWDEVDVEDGR